MKKDDARRRVADAIQKAVDDLRYEDLVYYLGPNRREVTDLLDEAEITVKVSWPKHGS